MRRFALLLMLAPAIAGAQTIAVSPKPDSVAVTVYRDPNRSSTRQLNLEWLGGYALVSETRRVTLPAGDSELRFEGVAGGIIPQSAIVAGFPDGIVERNQDAFLLSPGTLLDRSLGKRVHIRRTSAAGKVSESKAIIRSGIDGAVVLQTETGVEALRCSGDQATLIYDEVPPDLSAKPTLSVRVRSTRPIETTVTLSYLATGFDWQANYIAQVSPAGDRLDLFAWLTLANGDETGFANAATQAVAGKPNRERVDVQEAVSRSLRLNCWPHRTTTDGLYVDDTPRPWPPPPPPPPAAERGGDDYDSIVVTGSRIAMQAGQEDVADFKLYRIPEPVTVAARSQKQVALLSRERVTARRLLVLQSDVFDGEERTKPAAITFLAKNDKKSGLGIPLPQGRIVLFEQHRGRPVLTGESAIDDKAVGEEVEFVVGTSTNVMGSSTQAEVKGGWRMTYVVTNAGPRPVMAEVRMEGDPAMIRSPSRSLARKDGKAVWRTIVPANGRSTLRYFVSEDSVPD